MTALLPEWLASCSDAVALLDESAGLPPAKMIELTDAALRKVCQARDGMIERLRPYSDAVHAEAWRAALKQVNVALSELAAIEYPGALNRQHIAVASKLLQTLVTESEPPSPIDGRPMPDPSRPGSGIELKRVDAEPWRVR